jgi:hypothetical protein
MRSVAFVCALAALVHADATLPGAAPVPTRSTRSFRTPWPRLIECKQPQNATLYSAIGVTAN